MNTYNTIDLQFSLKGTATIWLNRPEKNNALNAEMIAELIGVFQCMNDNEDVRFLVLRGRGKHFSAGADLTWMQASSTLNYAANLREANELGELMSLLCHLPFPTVAVVHGGAFGGAVGLTACCDIAIGTADAVFSLSEVRIGLVPGVISPYLVQAIGERNSRRYALTGERFTGERAREIGLLAATYSAMELDEGVAQWIDLLLQNSPQAMRVCKALLQDVGSGVLSEELRQRTEKVIAGIRVSDEAQEGLSAFLQKRKPAWV